jgi:hypothetical protein
MTDEIEAFFKTGDADGGSDEIEIVARNDGVTVTVEEPWAGDTETGFGRSCSIRLSPADAAELGEWLTHWAAEMTTLASGKERP